MGWGGLPQGGYTPCSSAHRRGQCVGLPRTQSQGGSGPRGQKASGFPRTPPPGACPRPIPAWRPLPEAARGGERTLPQAAGRWHAASRPRSAGGPCWRPALALPRAAQGQAHPDAPCRTQVGTPSQEEGRLQPQEPWARLPEPPACPEDSPLKGLLGGPPTSTHRLSPLCGQGGHSQATPPSIPPRTHPLHALPWLQLSAP